MVSSVAPTRDLYLAELDETARAELGAVLSRVRAAMPVGFYLSAACDCVGGRLDQDAIARRWSGGKPLSMGKSCIRFRRAADLDLDLIAEVLGQWTAADFVGYAKARRT